VSVKRRSAFALVFATWALSLYYSSRDGVHWGRTAYDDRGFDAFAAEIAAAVPPTARVRIDVPGGPRGDLTVQRLNTALHPRVLVADGPAEWVIDLPGGPFDRSRSSFRRLAP
jgi:hypothetical protein